MYFIFKLTSIHNYHHHRIVIIEKRIHLNIRVHAHTPHMTQFSFAIKLYAKKGRMLTKTKQKYNAELGH